MNYPSLAAEIAKPDYAAKTDAEIVTLLKGAAVPGPFVDIPTSAIVGYLALAGKLYGIQKFANSALTGDPAHDGALVAANSLLTVMGTIPVFSTADDTKRQIMIGMLGAFVALGLISAGNETDLLAMATTSVTLLASLGCPELQGMDDGCVIDHMEIARGIDPQEARKSAP